MKTTWLLVLIGGAGLFLWLMLRRPATPTVPATRVVGGNDGGVLGSISNVIAGVKRIGDQLGGGYVYTNASPTDSNTLPGDPYYGPSAL